MKALQFLAVVLTALALVPAGAHLLALPNKMALDETTYLTVQGIYRGWSLLGFVPVAALAADLALAIGARRQPRPARLALVAALCLAATLVVFFFWTDPASRATADWTSSSAAWLTLRRQWEYSQAANAALTFVALCLAVGSALCWRREFRQP
jgi:hypothetical protein